MEQVLVTGGAGFLGSHLCDRLIKGSRDVLCVDNFLTGSKMNIAHLIRNPFFEFIRHDVTFPLYVEVDNIFNLACPASPIHYQHDPVQTTKTSVHGAINMLGLAKWWKARIFQVSTVVVRRSILNQKVIGDALTRSVLVLVTMKARVGRKHFFR